ncbi:MAG: hypothetical protein K2X48_11255 [Chitinophagaceae bacterium]|nr:hypothetical protein [Chitinophagaceae bacterium]
MQRFLFIAAALVLHISAFSQTSDLPLEKKSKEELIQFIKENIETYGNFMNGSVNYRMVYKPEEPNHISIAENMSGDFTWYKIDLAKADFGSTVKIQAGGKDNFFISFLKDISIKENKNKNARPDVAFHRKKDRRETDYEQLHQDLSIAFTLLIEKCKAHP